MPKAAFSFFPGCRPKNTCLFLSCLLELREKLDCDQNSNRWLVDFRDTLQLPSVKHKLGELAWDTSWTYSFWIEDKFWTTSVFVVNMDHLFYTKLPASPPINLYDYHSVLQSFKNKRTQISSKTQGEKIVQKKSTTPASPLAGRKEPWITECWCLFSSTIQPTHSAINLLPGNPLRLTCLCVFVYQQTWAVLLSDNGSINQHE